MIYKVLDKEEIGQLKEELSFGLPGTAKVYRHGLCFDLLVSIFSIYSIKITVLIVTKLIVFFLDFSNLSRKLKKRTY